MSIEIRQLQRQFSSISGGSENRCYRETRVTCDQCGTTSPWQPEMPDGPPPAWFLTRDVNLDGVPTTHLCGYCAGGGGKKALPKEGSIWWSYTLERSVAKVVTVDSLGGVSVRILHSATQATPNSDKRLQPLSGAGSIIFPVRDFYSAWGRPKPDDAILNPRVIWLNFTTGATVAIDGAEFLGGGDYLVCSGGRRIPFQEFILMHVPTGDKLPRSRYERLLEDDDG